MSTTTHWLWKNNATSWTNDRSFQLGFGISLNVTAGGFSSLFVAVVKAFSPLVGYLERFNRTPKREVEGSMALPLIVFLSHVDSSLQLTNVTHPTELVKHHKRWFREKIQKIK